METEKAIASFLKLAESELSVARYLYEIENYHKSLYMFQQSVEKAYKADALITRQIQLTDLENVRHDYVRLLEKSLNSLPPDTQNKVITDVFNYYGEEVDAASVMNTIERSNRFEFFTLTNEQIDYFINLIKQQKEMFSQIDLSLYIDAAISANKFSAEEIKNLQNTFNEEGKKEARIFLGHSVTLQYIGLMTSAHSDHTRYPNKRTGYTCPTEIYTIEMPLVRRQKELMEMASESINFIKTNYK
ncbi:MAG: HEPN domain-containing protein [Bacteroidia bacterium]